MSFENTVLNVRDTNDSFILDIEVQKICWYISNGNASNLVSIRLKMKCNKNAKMTARNKAKFFFESNIDT